MAQDSDFLRRRSVNLRTSEHGEKETGGRKSFVGSEEKSESQLSQAKAKNREYCRLFGLPPNEELIEEYNCALQRKILLQGKLYIFSSSVCFYSNVFGYITKRSIALKDVTSITKAKNVGFPNSIKFVHLGKQIFFTSFLSREDAFKLIITLWYECSPYARLSGILPSKDLSSMRFSYNGSDQDDGENSSANGSPSKYAHRKTLSGELEATDNHHHLDSPLAGVSTPPGTELQETLSLDSKRRASQSPGVSSREKSKLERRHSVSELNLKTKVKGAALKNSSANGSEEGGPDHRKRSSRGSSSEGIGLGMENFSPDEFDDVPLSGDNGEGYVTLDKRRESNSKPNLFLGTIKSENPPAVSPDMEFLCEAEFPICAYHFFATFLSDKSSFLRDFHEGVGDKNVILSQWKQLDAKFTGYVRNMTFSTPLSFSLGPESTHCDQTQRYSFYQYDNKDKEQELALIYETSQVNPDVPYGDYFKVCTRWDLIDACEHSKSVESDEDIEQYTDHTCTFKVHISVPFSKSTIMKGTIIQKTKQQCTQFYDKLISAINKHIYSLMETSMISGSQKSISDQDLTTKIPAEWREQIQLMLNLQKDNDPNEEEAKPKKKDFLDSSFTSLTEHLGYSRKNQETRLTAREVLGKVASAWVRILGWACSQMYHNGNTLLLVFSLMLNVYVLYVLFKGEVPLYGSTHKDSMAVRSAHHENLWKARSAHLTKELQMLEDYLSLLKTQQQLAKSME